MVLDGAFRNCGDPAIYLRRRRGRDAPVELAAAAAVRMAHAWLLAGARAAGTVPDFVRRTRPSQWTSRPAWMARALQTHDTRGAREVSSCDAGRIRIQSVHW